MNKIEVLEDLIRKMSQFNDIQIIKNNTDFPIEKIGDYIIRIKSNDGKKGCFFYANEEAAKYMHEVLNNDK